MQHASASKTMNASGSEMERVLVLMALIPWSVHKGGQSWFWTAWRGVRCPDHRVVARSVWCWMIPTRLIDGNIAPDKSGRRRTCRNDAALRECRAPRLCQSCSSASNFVPHDECSPNQDSQPTVPVERDIDFPARIDASRTSSLTTCGRRTAGNPEPKSPLAQVVGYKRYATCDHSVSHCCASGFLQCRAGSFNSRDRN